MKNIITIFILVFSFSAFSGDSYLHCVDKDGEYVTSAYIGRDTNLAVVEFNDMTTDKYTATVSLSYDERKMTIQIFEMNSGLLMEERTQFVSYFEEVNIISGYSCSLVD